ncbi:GNAT family N-acetyltransferase [Colwellia sp. RE-S-Sl-9]
MQLVQPLNEHLIEMMSWFSNEKDLTDWAGPNFSFPYNNTSFVDDLQLNDLSSFSLVSNDSDFLAFGQYYLRLGKCHLARLIVNPNFRGKGLAKELINCLCELGLKELNVIQCSLFVFSHNEIALNTYKKIGFTIANYPSELTIKNCLYMVK